jgi:hypothetical protein
MEPEGSLSISPESAIEELVQRLRILRNMKQCRSFLLIIRSQNEGGSHGWNIWHGWKQFEVNTQAGVMRTDYDNGVKYCHVYRVCVWWYGD